MSKKCFGIVILVLLVITGGIYKFIIQGSISINTDERTAIHLNYEERDLVLAEMRAFLTSIQQITKGISENDMQRVADHAKKVGRAAQGEMPDTLMAKLPIRFKQLGFDTHTKFDQLVMDTEDLGDSNHALSQLSILMRNCVSCHAAYRIVGSNK